MSTQWDQIKPNYASILADSLTSRRIPLLQQLQQVVSQGQIDEAELNGVAIRILKTYNYYQDVNSRNEALKTLEALVKYDSKYLAVFVKYINAQVLQKDVTMAVTDYLTLLNWINRFSILAWGSSESDLLGVVVQTQAAILNHAIAQSADFSEHHKHRVRVHHAVLVSTKTSIVESLSARYGDGSSDFGHADTYYTALLKSTLSPDVLLTYFGVLTDALVDLSATRPGLVEYLTKNLEPLVLEYYTNNGLLGKTAPSAHALSVFGKFVNVHIDQTDVESLLPHIEKAILRSSDNSLGTVLPLLFQNLSENIVMDKTLIESKLLGSILTGLKSIKEPVRIGAFSSLKSIVKHFNYESDELIEKFIDEVFKSFKSTSNTEYKALILSSLSLLSSPNVSTKIVSALLPLIPKDQNEVSLGGLVEAFAKHSFQLLASDVEKSVVDQIVGQLKAGLADKKLPLRRIWFDIAGEKLYSLNQVNDNVETVVKQIYPSLVASLEEAQQAPLPTVTNKGITSAYVAISLAQKYKNTIEATESIFINSLKPSGERPSLIDSRVYTKLALNCEFKWSIRALAATAKYIESLSEEERINYGSAWIYFIISANVPYSIHHQAIEALRQNLHDEKLSEVIIKSIYECLKSQDETLKLNIKSINTILPVLTQIPGQQQLVEQNLTQLLVVANHPSITIKSGWVGLVQRSGYSIDIAKLLSENPILESILQYTKLDRSNELYQAAVKAVGIVTFIIPETVSPEVARTISDDINLEKINEIDSQTVQIWNGTEGELVVDVLSQPTGKHQDKNTKDYEIKKWEESVKKELESKKKPRKLTREEQVVVNEQLAKESAIRRDTQALVNQVKRAFSLVRELVQQAVQVENGAKYWYPVAISKLLDVCKVPNVQELFGTEPVSTFVELSKLVSPRLGSLKEFVGIATVRIYNIGGLAENYLEEPLLDLVSRLLFRVKILSDQKPLGSLTLSYILPLLTRVLEIGKEVAIKNSSKQAVTSEFTEEDPEEEQLLLSIEIIAAHAEAFEDDSIPRTKILAVLLSLMKLPSKAKLAKECFLSMCQYIAPTYKPDDLKMLLQNIMTPNIFVRTAILEGIDSEFDLTGDITYSNEIWIAAHSEDSNSAEIASTIWEENQMRLEENSVDNLLELAGSEDGGLRLATAKAIVGATSPDNFEATLQSLINLYNVKKNPPAPILDRFGLVVKSSLDQKDTWEPRSTIALALKLLAQFFSSSNSIEKVFNFFVNDEALGDKDELVRQELQDAGIEIIKVHGAQYVETLIPIFEANLGAKDQRSKVQDNIKENVIILYGALAQHLSASDPRLESIIERLLKTLDTPSEDVQYAISKCIAPLVKSFESKLHQHFETLFDTLFNEKKSFAARRGAAYGISGLVKGVGIKALEKYDIIRTLTDAADDKKSPVKREGVSFVFECLALNLGPFFEPYVIEILPIILKSLGDTSAEVREATDSAAKQIMKNTTSFGVKKLIPLAISNLDEIAWRSKKGSVELLGSMAYLDPTQLSASLSTIVPEIVGVLNDTHKEVRKAADQSLKRFGEVIRNPEIQAIVPDLINAIGDPTKYTDIALDKLIKTQFVHYIDGPSLALIIHVIHRGMKDRSAGTKKKACQIVGNMAILVDSKDLSPYLGQLVAELEIAMVDPVPSTRSTAARALGSLVEKLGEERFPDLIPRLLDTLKDQSKQGDRLGSAQALAEVICGLGINKLEELLPTILASATSTKNYIKAGFMPLLLFLPVCFGTQFSPYLSKIIPPILGGLADTDEDIRDTALRAGRLIVNNYATKAVDLLLPELEKGLSDTSYRIRLSSVELTGDLLFQITGISGKTELDESSDHSTNEVNKTLVEILGQERRDRILASLFVCRSDTAGIVRSAAVDIWKALVANTPKTVKEILPSLTSIIIKRLASSEEVHRTIAAQTLGEMVRRVGSGALSRLLPTLQETLAASTNDPVSRQGICIALTELIKSTQYEGLVEYQDVFISIIREALVDSSAGIRASAAQAFESLQEELGKVVIDEILPHLLNMLQDTQGSSLASENALAALQEIMASKSDIIFPILIPTLLTPPIDSFKAKALASLASVAGSALFKRLGLIINTLISAILEADNKGDKEGSDDLKSAFDNILLSITSDSGVHPLMQQLLSLAKHEDSAKRAIVYGRLGNFFTHTTLDYSTYTQDMVSQFILSLSDPSPDVVQGTFETLTALVKAQPKESLERLVKPAYQALRLTGVKNEELQGFKIARGPNCILPVFLHGLMYGNADLKETSALAIADIIDKTPGANLKPFATTMTGPLIRVIGEKVSSDIKAAILKALNNLLIKIPQFLRPFIPQLQRTFVRSLSDVSNQTLRERAVVSLGTLISFQPRIDSLVTELVAGAKNTSDQGVKTSLLKAMLEVVNKAGKNMNESSKTSIMTLVEDEITVVDDKSAVSYARLIGSLANTLSLDEAANIIKSKVLEKPDGSNDKFCVLAINSFLRYSPVHIFNTGLTDAIVSFVIDCCNSSVPYITDNAVVAVGKLLILEGLTKSPKEPESIESESEFRLGHENIARLARQLAITTVQPASFSLDTRRLSLVVIRTISRFNFNDVKANFDVLIPSIFVCLRDSIIPIKLAAEKAYLSVFNLVEDVEMAEFNAWFSGKENITTVTGASIVPRSIGDYTKRVAARLAGVERERIEAGGDAETMFSDRFEDEEEVWTVG